MTPNLSAAFYNYGQIHVRTVKTIMARLSSEPIFGDRLLLWLDDCSKSPLKAVDPERAKTAMCDMVALRLCCYGFSVEDGKLTMTDLGGAVASLVMLCDALALIANHDRELGEHLIPVARNYADLQQEKIKSLLI
jgi:hypothetical protein